MALEFLPRFAHESYALKGDGLQNQKIQGALAEITFQRRHAYLQLLLVF